MSVTGINLPTAIGIAGGEYSLGSAVYTSSAGTVTNGETVNVRLAAVTTPGGTAEAVLTIGGVSATFRVTTSDDVTPPTAAIIFPPPVARTGGAAITVRGTAADASGALAAVRVNGVLATTTNGFATWTAVVPLEPGANTLTASAEDGFLNVANAVAEVAVQRNARLGTSNSIALDAANGRVFVVDGSADAVVAVDLATKIRTWFADTAAPGLRRKEALPLAVVHDATRNRLLVLDGFDEAIVAIDLATRQRTLLSGRRTSSVNRFQSPTDLAIDADRNRVLVTTNSPAGIIAVDLNSGARTVLSDATMPDSANMFVHTGALALDPAHNQLLVTDVSTNSIYAVDLISGARKLLSSNTFPDALEPFDRVGAMEVDPIGNRALLPQFCGRVLAVDLVGGQRTELSPSACGATLIHDVWDLAVDSAANRVIVLDAYRHGLAAINLADGTQTLVSPNDAVSGGISLVQPAGLVLDLPNGRALVADEFWRGIVAIDLAAATGVVAVDGSTGPMQFASPWALALDAPSNRLFILQSGRVVGFPAAVFVHDLATGARSILSGPAWPDGTLPFVAPQEMALDALGMRLLVTERDERAVKAVDLVSGARSIVSSNTVPNAATPFATPLGVIVDAPNARALVASSGFGPGSSVLAMSLATGQRSVVAANTSGTLTGPRLLALDAARNRVLVVDELWQTLYAADLTTGAIGGVTDLDDPVNPIDAAYGLGHDSAKQIAYLVEGHYAAILAVDLVTGQRAFLSH
jgi:sugar lactone lactonase YvrE